MDKNMRFLKFVAEHPNHNVAKNIMPLSRSTKKQILEEFTRRQLEEASQAAREYMESHPGVIKRELRAIDAGRPSVIQPLVTKWQQARMKRSEARAKRYEEIVTLRTQGMTYGEIGETINPPVSRERIRQILNKIDPSLTSGIVMKPRNWVKVNCTRCGIEFEKDARNIHKSNYCSKAHMRKYTTPEEAKKAAQKYYKDRYHSRPDVRAKHKKLCIARYHKVKHTEAHKAKQKIYTARWWAKKKQDPEFMAKYRADMARRYRERYHWLRAQKLTAASSAEA